MTGTGTDPRCPTCGAIRRRVVCAHCSAPFAAHSAQARYCSTRCRVAAHRERHSD